MQDRVKVINKREVESVLLNKGWLEYDDVYDPYNIHVYLYNSKGEKLGVVRFDTYLRTNIDAFFVIHNAYQPAYYIYNIYKKANLWRY